MTEIRYVSPSHITGIPHEGKTISFEDPPCRGHYGIVSNKIKHYNLEKPTSSEIISLIYHAFKNSKSDERLQYIHDLMWHGLSWEFTGHLYLPKSNEEINNGIILENNPTIFEESLVMDKKSLVDRLKNEDPNVKFVPYGFKTKEFPSTKEFEKNRYILARYGEEGTQKISELASLFPRPPSIFILDYEDRERIAMPSLSVVNNPRLLIDATYNGPWSDDSVLVERGFCFGKPIKE